MKAKRVLVIYKKSTYQRYAARGKKRLQKLIDAKDVTVADLTEEHKSHLATIGTAKAFFKGMGVRATFCHRPDPLPEDGWDLIVTLGGDGTLLWASHLADQNTPMISINSAPNISVGYFSAGDATNVEATLGQALEGSLRATKLSRMQVELDGQLVSKRVLNDVLFSDVCPAATTRYVIDVLGGQETQMSSGVWVGPAAGSTAAIRSAGGKVLPIMSQKIQYVVREPYKGKGIQYALVKGTLSPPESVSLHCQMTEAQLYLDGAQKSHPVKLGQVVRMCVSDEPLLLHGLSR